MAVVTLVKKRLRRDIQRHPWVYENSVQSVEGEVEDGGVVEVLGPDGSFVAWGLINRSSRLYVRMYSFRKDEQDPAEVFGRRLDQAIALRRDVLRLPERADSWRVVHSEGDGIPGLIVDKYNDVAVISCSALGTFKVLDTLVPRLAEGLGVSSVFEIGAAKGLRGKEGLPPGRGALHGPEPEADGFEVTVDGLRFHMQISGGQKTGLFLDQRDNVQRFAELCHGETVLDACTYAGAFALNTLRAGAKEVLAFDISRKALANTERNAELNGLSENLSLRKGDLFDVFRELREEGKTFSRIVFDPPAFAARKKDIPRARKAYTEAHSLALAVLEPGGIMLTASCSHHLNGETLESSLHEASRRQSRTLQVLYRFGAGPDHPQQLFCPEGRYLNGLVIRDIA